MKLFSYGVMKLASYGVTLVLSLALTQVPKHKATAPNEESPAPATCRDTSSLDDSEDDDVSAAEVLVAYATAVDGLLRDHAAQMRVISENVEAGDLAPAEAAAQKLETMRAMIARLETISAVVDDVIFSDNDISSRDPEPNCPSLLTAKAQTMPRARRVISVKELMRENIQ